MNVTVRKVLKNQNKTKHNLDMALTIVVQMLLWRQVEEQQVTSKCAQNYVCFLGTPLPCANGMFLLLLFV